MVLIMKATYLAAEIAIPNPRRYVSVILSRLLACGAVFATKIKSLANAITETFVSFPIWKPTAHVVEAPLLRYKK